MKIALVSLSGLPVHVDGVEGAFGGAETQTAVLGEALRRRGHDAIVIVTDYDERSPLPRRTALPLANAYRRRAGVPGLRFFHPRWTGLHRAIARLRPDVVFQMCAGAGTGQIAWTCRRIGAAFVFATASDSDVDPRRLRLGARDRRFYEYGLRRADRVVTQHARQAEQLLVHYGVRSTPIPLGAELPAAISAPDEPPTVAWLGTLRRVKRPERWLDMAERFPAVPFVMAGARASLEPGIFDAAKERAGRLGNVRFLGPVPSVEAVLHGAYLLLNTSEVEGFPTTFLEAWGRGIPVVSYFDPDGLVARHGLGAIAGDAEEMARLLAEYLGDRAARDAAGRRARSYVERTHAPDAVAERIEAVLREAVAAREARRA